MKVRNDFATDAEWNAYEAGKQDVTADWDDQNILRGECVEVRKIACALIRGTSYRRPLDLAEDSWAIWRAIKAGQEGKP